MAINTNKSVSTAGNLMSGQPVRPNFTPADVSALIEALTPSAARFRKQSSQLRVDLEQVVFTQLGQSIPKRISSVGLGYRTVRKHHVTILVKNVNVGAVAFAVSSAFPFNLINNTKVSINGGATIYSAGGLAGLLVAMRNRVSGLALNTNGGYGPALDPSLVKIGLAANLTATNSSIGAPKLGGIASISQAASQPGGNLITVDFVTIEKFALDRNSMLGALPLQNNSTFATIEQAIVSALNGNSDAYPFKSANGTDQTFSLVSYTVDTTYEFSSVPGDAALYAAMVSNSYQVQEQTALTFAAVGSQGLVYNIPQNMYLLAAHLLLRDSAGDPIPYASLPNMYIKYNAGTIIPVTIHQAMQRAEHYCDYGYDPSLIPGYRLWDGENTSESLTETDDMGWIDTFMAATPQLIADIDSGVAVPASYSLTRESVVPGAVQVIGG